jgi:hypothetical protein
MKNTLQAALTALALTAMSASAVPVTFTQLTGLTGGRPEGTAVYRASLGGLGVSSLLSITITDASSGLGGSPGQFSGFDLDAIKLSTTSVTTADDAQGLAGLSVFNFGAALFTPGTQRPTVDPKLFGTGAGGNTVDNAVATLGAFDANSTTGFGAFGFLSMGDGGVLTLNLTSAVSTTGLYLYIGEVGDNGEVAASSVEISDRTSGVPDTSSTIIMLGMAMLGLGGVSRIRRR